MPQLCSVIFNKNVDFIFLLQSPLSLCLASFFALIFLFMLSAAFPLISQTEWLTNDAKFSRSLLCAVELVAYIPHQFSFNFCNPGSQNTFFFFHSESYRSLTQQYSYSVYSDQSLPSEKGSSTCSYADITIPAALPFLQVQTYIFYRFPWKGPCRKSCISEFVQEHL